MVAPSEHCAVIVSKEVDDKGYSKVVSRACSTVSIQDAHRRATEARTDRPADSVTTLTDTLLLEEYEDINYGGDKLYQFYGTDGGCDYEGYHLVNFWSVENNVSSMKGYNGCNRVAVHTENCNAEETECDWGYFDLDVSYLGTHYNDNVVALRTYHV